MGDAGRVRRVAKNVSFAQYQLARPRLSPRATENDARAREINSARRSRECRRRSRRRAVRSRAEPSRANHRTSPQMMQNPSFGRLNRVRIRRKVGKRWSTKSSDRRREEHKETKRYRGFLTSSDIGTYPAHAVLTEKFRWVSVIFRGCGRLITMSHARPFSRAPWGVTTRKLRVLLTPFTYCNTRTPMNSQNAPLHLSPPPRRSGDGARAPLRARVRPARAVDARPRAARASTSRAASAHHRAPLARDRTCRTSRAPRRAPRPETRAARRARRARRRAAAAAAAHLGRRGRRARRRARDRRRSARARADADADRARTR